MSQEVEREVLAVETLGLLNAVECLEHFLELADEMEARAKLIRQAFREAREEYRDSYSQGCRLFGENDFKHDLRLHNVAWEANAKRIREAL